MSLVIPSAWGALKEERQRPWEHLMTTTQDTLPMIVRVLRSKSQKCRSGWLVMSKSILQVGQISRIRLPTLAKQRRKPLNHIDFHSIPIAVNQKLVLNKRMNYSKNQLYTCHLYKTATLWVNTWKMPTTNHTLHASKIRTANAHLPNCEWKNIPLVHPVGIQVAAFQDTGR